MASPGNPAGSTTPTSIAPNPEQSSINRVEDVVKQPETIDTESKPTAEGIQAVEEMFEVQETPTGDITPTKAISDAQLEEFSEGVPPISRREIDAAKVPAETRTQSDTSSSQVEVSIGQSSSTNEHGLITVETSPSAQVTPSQQENITQQQNINGISTAELHHNTLMEDGRILIANQLSSDGLFNTIRDNLAKRLPPGVNPEKLNEMTVQVYFEYKASQVEKNMRERLPDNILFQQLILVRLHQMQNESASKNPPSPLRLNKQMMLNVGQQILGDYLLIVELQKIGAQMSNSPEERIAQEIIKNSRRAVFDIQRLGEKALELLKMRTELTTFLKRNKNYTKNIFEIIATVIANTAVILVGDLIKPQTYAA